MSITCAVAGDTYHISLQVSELSNKHDITVFIKLGNTVSTFNKHHILLWKILLKYAYVLKSPFTADETQPDAKVRSFVDDIELNGNITVRASCCLDKTYFGMKPLIAKCNKNNESMLFITGKVSLAHHFTGILGLENHNNVKVTITPDKHKTVAVQFGSLYRINGH